MSTGLDTDQYRHYLYSVLIRVQTVCKAYQRTTKVATSKERVQCSIPEHQLIMIYVAEIAHAVLCQASQSTYVQCDTCCGAQGHQYCCDDTTTAQATEEEAA